MSRDSTTVVVLPFDEQVKTFSDIVVSIVYALTLLRSFFRTGEASLSGIV